MGIAGKTGFHLTAVPMDWITSAMSSILFEMPVLDETGLSGLWNLDVDWGEPVPADIIAAFRSAGLQITRERRELEILVFEPAAEPGA